jgi:thermitase
MKKLFAYLFLYCFSIALFAQNPSESKRIILKYKDDVYASKSLENNAMKTGIQAIDNINKEFDVQKIQKVRAGKTGGNCFYVMQYPEGTDLQKVLDAFNKSAGVVYAEIDGIGHTAGIKGVTPNDTYYHRQWSLKNDGSFSMSPAVAGADIDMENAWGIEQGDSTIIVGIIDTGDKLDHPEFAGRIWINTDEIPGNGIDDDGNTKIDDVKGWDFANSDIDPTDDEGHGTNVAGIIGANGNNSLGYAGVDWHCKLMILKGINSANWGYFSWWADAIYYAVDNGARVINMSLGGTGSSTTLQDAVTYALNHNVILVVCMMNTNNNDIYIPVSYTGVIAVGSTDANDHRSNPFFWDINSGSNYNSYISVVAPGNYIYGLAYDNNTEYGSYWGGTSQATPHVAGLASLILAQNPSLSPLEVKTIIENTAEDQVGLSSEDTPGWDQYYGHGRVNAYQALSMVAGISHNNSIRNQAIIYPNPSNGSFRLTTSLNLPVQFKIMNQTGQEVYNGKLIENSTYLNLALSSSLYLIRLQSDDGSIETGKLMVR